MWVWGRLGNAGQSLELNFPGVICWLNNSDLQIDDIGARSLICGASSGCRTFPPWTIPPDNSPWTIPPPVLGRTFPPNNSPQYIMHTNIYMYAYTRICIHTYMHTYIYTHIHIHIHIQIYMYIHTYTCIHIHAYIYIHTCTDIHIHLYVCMRVYYVCMYVCMYIYMYKYAKICQY